MQLSDGLNVKSLKRQRELEKQRKQLEKMEEIERATYEVEVFDNHIDIITSIHKDCSDPWDWKKIKPFKPPVKRRRSDKFESAARATLEAFEPKLIDKMT